MDQRSTYIGLLVFVLVAFAGIIVYDVKHTHKFEKLFSTNKKVEKNVSNWKWEDDWKPKDLVPNVEELDQKIQDPKVELSEPEALKEPQSPKQEPMTATSYMEALKMSEESGKPVLAYFTASWCSYCIKMKKETLESEKVKDMMKNYIFVMIDVDRERNVAAQFEVGNLPAYVITNNTQTSLQQDIGFKDADTFTEWLNKPEFFKKDDPKTAPLEKKKKRRGLEK